MKNLMYYCIGSFILVLGSLFLPYVKFDMYGGGLFSPSHLTVRGMVKNGFKIPAAYIPLLGIVIISGVTLIKRNLVTAIIGLVLGFLLFLFIPVLAFGLTFNLSIFGGPRNHELQIGFFVFAIATFAFFVTLIIHLVKVARERKRARNAPEQSRPVFVESDLLDDF